MRRTFAGDARAISNVVGALLLLAMGVTVFGTVRVSYSPVVTHDEEAQHMRLVTRQFASLKADLDGHVLRDVSFPGTHPFTLGREGSSSMAEADPPDKVRLGSPKSHLTLTADTFIRLGDAAGEVWTPVAGAPAVTDVGELLNLRLKIADVSTDVVGGWTTIELHDGADPSALAATFRVSVSAAGGGGFYYDVATLRADGSEVYRDRRAGFAGDHVQPLWVDALAPEYRLLKTVATATRPLRLEVAQSILTTDYTLHYSAFTEGGQLIGAGGSGAPEADFLFDETSARFEYQAANQRFVDQQLLLEHGAFVLAQGTQAVLRADPLIDVAFANNVVMIEILAPVLSGDEASAQGHRTVTAAATRLSRTEEAIAAPAVTLRVDTGFPSLWADHLRTLLERVGLTDEAPDPDFDLSTDATGTTLQINGVTPGPATYDVRARIVVARVNLEVRS